MFRTMSHTPNNKTTGPDLEPHVTYKRTLKMFGREIVIETKMSAATKHFDSHRIFVLPDGVFDKNKNLGQSLISDAFCVVDWDTIKHVGGNDWGGEYYFLTFTMPITRLVLYKDTISKMAAKSDAKVRVAYFKRKIRINFMWKVKTEPIAGVA